MRISDWSSDVCSSDLDRDQGIVSEGQFHILHVEQFSILFDKGVLRLGEDLDQRLIVEILQRCDNRKAADEFGDQTEFQQILRLALAQKQIGSATSELQSLMRISSAVCCTNKKNYLTPRTTS